MVGQNAWNPILDGGGADIQDGKLVFDYSGDLGTDPASTVQADLTASYNAQGGRFASGQIHSSTASANSTALGWRDVSTSQTHQVTIARTIYGNVDLNGTAGFSDLNTLLNNYNHSGQKWSAGDFNYNGTVNFSDLNTLLNNYNHSATPLPPQVVEISRLGSETTAANSVQFAVIFSEAVTGVNASDFVLNHSGTSGTIATVNNCSPSHAVYVVTVNNISGNGTLGLNLIDDASIRDTTTANNPLSHAGFTGSAFVGQNYTMTGPFVWVGGGSDGNWSTPANWLDGVLPTAGSGLLFEGTPPAGGACDDFPEGTSFASIEFASNGFSVTGDNALTLNDGITVDAGVADATISMDVVADGLITIAVADADATLTMSGTLSGDGSLTKTGDGTLTVAADTQAGGTTVTGGTLLVGSLPSVFESTLDAGVGFSTERPDAVLAADPGTSGGTFALSGAGSANGSLVLGSDGIMYWNPNLGCQPGTYTVTATYTYTGGKQIKTFSVNIADEDMPPAFGIGLPDSYELLWRWNEVHIESQDGHVSQSLAAYDHEGPVTYALSAATCRPTPPLIPTDFSPAR